MKKTILIIVLFLYNSCFGGAIAQWKMNDAADNSTVTDSVGSYTGTYQGSGSPDDTTLYHSVTGQINNALSLDGTNNYITVSDDDVFSFAGAAFSITAWIKLDASGGAEDFDVLNKMDSGSAAIEWQFVVSADALYLNCYDSANGGNIGRADTADYSLYEGSGFFIFVVGTYDGSGKSSGIKLYLDGQRADDADNNNGTFSIMVNGNEDLRMGYADGAPSKAKGFIDNVVVYNNELSAAQVDDLWNNGAGTEVVTITTYVASSPRVRYSNGYRYRYRNRY